MIRLTPEAEKIRDDYLQQARNHLEAASTADPDEVGRDLREHIERELQGAEQPVSASVLRQVLERLGRPEEWVGEQDLSWWRQAIVRLRGGPEDWRLAYASLAVLIVGTALVGLLGILGSFLLARAAVEEPPDYRQSPGKKWLVYPSLLLVYVPIAWALFCWPLHLTGYFRPLLDFVRPSLQPYDLPRSLAQLAVSVLALTLWWSLLLVLVRNWPRSLRALFRPFADGIGPRQLGRVVKIAGVTGLALTGITLVVWYLGGAKPEMLVFW